MSYRVIFYESSDGVRPTEAFLEGYNAKIRAKFVKLLAVLEEQGPNLKRPYADSLRDGIRELRVVFGGNAYRALFFFSGADIVITHAFIKKTDRVPDAEIERALRFKRDYDDRIGGREP